MKTKRAARSLLALLILVAGQLPAFGGDSLYGKVTAVRSAEVVVFDYGAGSYVVRLIGILAPETPARAREARQFLANLVLGKNVRMRFDHRAANGEMVSRLFTDDPVTGIKEVGVELLKAGVVRRQADYDGKYGELSAAENEARAAKRGIWASSQQR